MNIVDIIILAIFIYFLLAGMYKGTIASGISLFGFAGAWFGAKAMYQGISNLALSNSTLMAVLNQYLEPETFFTEHAVATAKINDVLAGGEASIQAVIASIGKNFSFIADALSSNIRTQAFASIGINTMADYFNQTLWVAVFNVVAFVAAFIALYAIISILISLLDSVISFPVLRSFDWLVGGLFGILRATVVVVLVLSILPAITNVINPDLTQNLLAESTLYTFASQLDLLGVAGWLRALVMG